MIRKPNRTVLAKSLPLKFTSKKSSGQRNSKLYVVDWGVLLHAVTSGSGATLKEVL